MRRLVLVLAATAATGALTGSAQAYEWGGGSCVGYGCVRDVHDGYDRAERRDRVYEERPAVRVYEHRGTRTRPDWDDGDEE
jgi:hypothetical protein